MSTTRPFAYNTGSAIEGTIQVGTLSVGVSEQDYSSNPGGVKWWMGPDEDLGYVIAKSVPSNTQPTEVGVTASVGFERTSSKTDELFIELSNRVVNQGFTGATQASIWLTDNGYWNSYLGVNVTPTPTNTPTPTGTNTPTPTGTNTPTPTPTSTSITPTPTPTPTSTLTPYTGTTVTIGSQIWTDRNLDVTTYRNGDLIPQVTDYNEWRTATTGAWCYYNNNSANNNAYGKLYNWYAVTDSRGLAPIGFHVPSYDEFLTLIDSAGGVYFAQFSLVETGTTYWAAPNYGATNATGFSARAGGYRDGYIYGNSNFSQGPLDGGTPMDQAQFWTTTSLPDNTARHILIQEGSNVYTSGALYKTMGYSVRLVKD
jgi:uncharacterized protein (TIGR02145 family)